MSWLLADSYTSQIPPAAVPGLTHPNPGVTAPPNGWLGPMQGTADAAQNAVTGAAQSAKNWLQGQADTLQQQAEDAASGNVISQMGGFKDSIIANLKTGGWNIAAALAIVAGVWLILED